MRKSRIPGPPTAEDILGARLHSVKKQFDGMALTEFSETNEGTPVAAASGFFIGFTIIDSARPIGVGGAVQVDNDLKLCLMFIPFDIPIVAINFEITGAFATQFMGIGLYDKDFNLVVDTGPIDANPARIVRQVITEVDLPAGVYWMGVTAKATGGGSIPSTRILPVAGNALNILNSGSMRYGRIPAVGVGGQLPASFDATAIISDGAAMPYVLFEAAPQ